MDIDSTTKTQKVDTRGFKPKTRDRLSEIDPDILMADGFDNCIVGFCYTPGPGYRAVYDAEKIIDTLIERDGMTWEEANEYFEFNTEGAYVGEKTPIFWRRLPEY